jgi:hypothetical protein
MSEREEEVDEIDETTKENKGIDGAEEIELGRRRTMKRHTI